MAKLDAAIDIFENLFKAKRNILGGADDLLRSSKEAIASGASKLSQARTSGILEEAEKIVVDALNLSVEKTSMSLDDIAKTAEKMARQSGLPSDVVLLVKKKARAILGDIKAKEAITTLIQNGEKRGSKKIKNIEKSSSIFIKHAKVASDELEGLALNGFKKRKVKSSSPRSQFKAEKKAESIIDKANGLSKGQKIFGGIAGVGIGAALIENRQPQVPIEPLVGKSMFNDDPLSFNSNPIQNNIQLTEKDRADIELQNLIKQLGGN